MALFLDPVSGLLALQRELERAFQHPLNANFGVSGRGVFPAANVFSGADGYVLRLEIPGVAPEQLQVQAEGRTLTIKGKREVHELPGASFHRRERESGEFSRSIQLPDALDPSQAAATYKHGILTLRVPLKKEAQPRQISVQAS